MREPIRQAIPFRQPGPAPAPRRLTPLPGGASEPAAPNFIGQSPALLAAVKVARQVADSTATVLIHGESGTGKEQLARLIHDHSRRARGPFVAVNCAAIPETLLETELFGHEKGAFTGAAARRVGRFERATGGTLFLDEVGDMSPGMQAKILRALQEEEIERVGGDRPVPVDVRILAATNRDLDVEVEAARFREDLYYRLAVVVLKLPPLRERGDDIVMLARHFLEHFARKHGRAVHEISAGAMDLLRSHGWPGNIRQLRNVIERVLILAEESGAIQPSELEPQGATPDNSDTLSLGPAVTAMALREARELFEREYLVAQINRFGGNISRTAQFVGMERSALHRKLKSLGVVGGMRSDEEMLMGK
jgi:two-component system, NtrC family, nitrogen regulation response regulator NtrX